MQLTAIAEEGDILQKYDSLRCEDLGSCYHQYALSQRSVLASGCKYRNKIWVCQTMMYGPAPCVIIANSALELATNAIALRSKCYVRTYIDDVIQAPGFPDYIKPHLKELGFFLADKEQAGPVVDYTGFTLDAEQKTISVKEKTRNKIKKSLDDNLFEDEHGVKYMNYEHLGECLNRFRLKI